MRGRTSLADSIDRHEATRQPGLPVTTVNEYYYLNMLNV